MLSLSDKKAKLQAQERVSSPDKKAELEAQEHVSSPDKEEELEAQEHVSSPDKEEELEAQEHVSSSVKKVELEAQEHVSSPDKEEELEAQEHVSSPDKEEDLQAQEHVSSSVKKAELEAQDQDMLKYFTIDGLMASVIEGSIKPLSGRYLVGLARGQRAWLGEVLFGPSMVCPGWGSLQKDWCFVACSAVLHKIRSWTVGEEARFAGRRILHPQRRSPQGRRGVQGVRGT